MTVIGLRKDRYLELLEKEAKLDALEAAGVDNWEGFSIAMSDEYFTPVSEKEYKND